MLPFGVLTSPASAALSGAVRLAWISESLQEIGQRQSREGLLEGGQPSPAPPGAWSSAGEAPPGLCLQLLRTGALVTGGRGADVPLAPAPRQAHFLAQRVLLPLCLPCRLGHLDPSKGASFWRSFWSFWRSYTSVLACASLGFLTHEAPSFLTILTNFRWTIHWH